MAAGHLCGRLRVGCKVGSFLLEFKLLSFNGSLRSLRIMKIRRGRDGFCSPEGLGVERIVRGVFLIWLWLLVCPTGRDWTKLVRCSKIKGGCSEIRGPIANCKNVHDNYYFKRAGLEQLSEDQLYNSHQALKDGKMFPELNNELIELPGMTKNLLLTGKLDTADDFYESLVYFEENSEDDSDKHVLHSAINHDGSMLFSFNARVRRNAIVPIYYKRPVQSVPLEERLTYYIHPLYLIADFLETDMNSKSILDIIEPLMLNNTCGAEQMKRNIVYCKKLKNIKDKVLGTEGGGYQILYNLIRRKRSGSLQILKKLIQYGLDIGIFERFPQLFTLAVRNSNHSLVRYILSEISSEREASRDESPGSRGSLHSCVPDASATTSFQNSSLPETQNASPDGRGIVLDLDFLSRLQGKDSSGHCHFRDQRRQSSDYHNLVPGGRSSGCYQKSLVNMVDNYNHTSLFYAVENNDLEMAEILISSGACVNMWDPRTGQNPLMVALENHNGAMLSLIMDNGGDPLRISPISGLDVMDLAIQENDGKMIERIVNHSNYDINTSDNDIGSIILEYATFQDKSDLKLIGKTFKKQLNRDYFFKQLKDYEKEARHVLDIVKIRISDVLLSRLLKMESKKKVAIICQVTDEDGRGAFWWSAYHGNIKQVQHLLDFYSKAIRNRWIGYQNCNPHRDDKYGIYPLNLIIRKASRIPKKLIIDMLQFRDPQTNSPLVLQVLTKSKQPLRALKSIIHALKENYNISYSFINIWSNGSNVIDPIYYALRKKLSTNVIYYLLELAVKYSEESIGSTSLWRRRVSNYIQILKNVKNVDILSMLQLHENHFSHFDHEDSHIFGGNFNDNLVISLKKRSESSLNERSILREPKGFFTNSFTNVRNIFDNKWRTNINFPLQSEESQANTPSNTIPPEDFPLVISPPRMRSIFSISYVHTDKSPESIAKIILGRGPSHKSVENIRRLIEHAVGLDSDKLPGSTGRYRARNLSPYGGNTGTLLSGGVGDPRKRFPGESASFGQAAGNGSHRIPNKASGGSLEDHNLDARLRRDADSAGQAHTGHAAPHHYSHLQGPGFARKDSINVHGRQPEEYGGYSSPGQRDESPPQSHLRELLSQRSYPQETPRGADPLVHKDPLSRSSSPQQSSEPGAKPSSPHSLSSYAHPNVIPSHFLYPFGEASTDAIYSIVKLRPETIGEILTRVSYKSPSDAIRVLALLDALPRDFPPFNAHAYSPLQRAASILYQYKGQRDILPVIHALLSSRYVKLFSSEQLMESLNLLALIEYRPSNVMELFGGLPSYCQYYGIQSGNVRYHYSKSDYWEMNSSSSEKETVDEGSLGSSVGVGDRKGISGIEGQSQGQGYPERETGGRYWNLNNYYYRDFGQSLKGDRRESGRAGGFEEGSNMEQIRGGCPIKLSILEKLRKIPALPWDKRLTESDIMFIILCLCAMLTLSSIYCSSSLDFYSVCNSINKKLTKYSSKFNCEIPLSDVTCNLTMDFGLVFMLNIPSPSKDSIMTGLWNSIKACFLINKISDFPVKKYRNTQENLYESFQYSLITFIIKFSNVFNSIKLVSILIFLIWILVFQLYEEILCFAILTCIAIVIYTFHGFRIDESMYEQLNSCFKYNNSLLLPEIMILYEQTNNQVIRIAKRAIYLHRNLKCATASQGQDAKEVSSKQIQKLLVSRNNLYPENTYTEVPEIGLLEISKLCYNNADKTFKCYRLLFVIQLICLILSFLITLKLPFNCYNSQELLAPRDSNYGYAEISSVFRNINSCRKLYQFQYPHLFHLTRFYPFTVSILHFTAFIYYWQLLSMIASPILSIILALYHFHSLASIFNSALSTPISTLLPNAKNSKLLISQSYSSKEASRANSVATPIFSADKQLNNHKPLANDDKNSMLSSNGYSSPNHANATKNSSNISIKAQSNPNVRLQSVGEITSPGSLDIHNNARSQTGNIKAFQSQDGFSFSPQNTHSLLPPSSSITPKNSINSQSPEIRLSNFLKLNHYSMEIQLQDYEPFEMNYSDIYPCNIDHNSEASYYQVLEAQIYPFFIWADSRRTSYRICKYFWKPTDLFRDLLAISTIFLAMVYYYVEFKSLPIKTIRLWNIIPISMLLLAVSLVYIMYIMVEIHQLTVEFWQWVPDVYDILPICSNLLDSVETTMRLLPFLTSPFYILNTPVKLPLLYGSIFVFVMLFNVNFN